MVRGFATENFAIGKRCGVRRSIQFLVYCVDKKHFYDKAVNTSIDALCAYYFHSAVGQPLI